MISRQELERANSRDPLFRDTISQQGGPSGFFENAADVAQGVLNGIEEGFHGIAGLANPLTKAAFGWDINESLEGRLDFIDAPETTLGNLAGGVAQFAPGLLVGGFGIGVAASKLPALRTALTAMPNAAKAAAVAGNRGKAALLYMGQGAAQGAVYGAVADFIAFRGDEGRLSDMVQGGDLTGTVFEPIANTAVVQFITDILANDPDIKEDTLKGRLQNVGEGLLLGGLFDAVFQGTKGLLKANKVNRLVAAGSDPEKAIKAVYKMDRPEKVKLPEERELNFDKLPDTHTVNFTEDGVPKTKTMGEVRKEISAQEAELRKGLRNLTEEDIADFAFRVGQDTKVNPRNLSKGTKALLGLEKHARNLSMYHGTEDSGIRMIRLMEKMAGDDLKPGEFKLDEEAATSINRGLELLKLSDADRQDLNVLASQQPEAIYKAFRISQAAKIVSMAEAPQLRERLAQVMGTPGYTQVQLDEVITRMESNLQGLKYAGDTVTAIARSLRGQAIPIDVDDIAKQADNLQWTNFDRLKELAELGVNDVTRPEITRILKEYDTILSADDALAAMGALNRWAEAPTIKRVGAFMMEYWLNALLSTPGTWVVNAMSGLTMSVWQPLETSFGAGLRGIANPAVRDEMFEVVAREMKTITGFLSQVQEAWRISGGWKGMTTDEAKFYRGGSTKFDDVGSFSAVRQTIGDDTLFQRALGSTLTFPGQVLNKFDDFFKALNYRAYARAELSMMAKRANVPTGDVEGFIHDRLQAMIHQRATLRQKEAVKQAVPKALEGGTDNLLQRSIDIADMDSEGVKEILNLHDKSINRGQDIAFSRKLAEGEGVFQVMGVRAESMVHAVPAFRIALPFIKTPANIAQYGFERTFGSIFQSSAVTMKMLADKLGIESKSLEYLTGRLGRELTSADPEVAAKAMGRVMTSVGFLSALAGWSTYLGGTLPMFTGAGPTDKEERDALVALGWQPYSFRGPDGRYYSYNRFDPFATLIGSIADYAEAQQRNALDAESTEMAGFVPAVVAALSNNITNKTYFAGLQNVFKLVTGDERTAEMVVNGSIASLIPGIAANSVGAQDPYMREIRGLADKIVSRTPGMSDTLQPRRNIFGEKIKRPTTTDEPYLDLFLPTRATTVSDSVVEREIANLRYGFNPIKSERGGVSLVDEKYVVGGQDALDRYSELSGTIKLQGKTLRQAVRTLIADQRYQAFSAEQDEVGNDSYRIVLINKIIRRYREAAWRELVTERPQILADVNAVRAQKLARKSTNRPSLFN